LRKLLRYEVLAALVAAILFTLQEGEVVRSSAWLVMGSIYVVVFGILIFILLRFGLVATIATVYFANVSNAILLGADWKAWHAPASVATVLLMLGITVFAFWRSLGNRDLLGGADETVA